VKEKQSDSTVPSSAHPEEPLGMKPQGYVPASASPSAHEGADLDVPAIARLAVVLAATLAVSILVITLLFVHFEHKYPARTSEAAPVVTAAELPPAPGVTADPDRELREVQAKENLHLDRYGWVDRPHGIAQIPIERAMTLWVQNYSATPPPASPPPTTELQMRQQKATENPHVP
jgi:hypothetical protein